MTVSLETNNVDVVGGLTCCHHKEDCVSASKAVYCFYFCNVCFIPTLNFFKKNGSSLQPANYTVFIFFQSMKHIKRKHLKCLNM